GRQKIDIRRFAGVKFAAIGSGTAAALESRGIFPDLVPEKYTAAALGRLLSQKLPKGEKALILRAEKGSAELTHILDENGVLYDEIKTYDVVCDENLSAKTIETDYITFASSSGVEAFFENGFKLSQRTKAVCIGEITAETLKKYGVSELAVSKIQNIQGIADVIMSEKA
ncbi:MAG: uroporphyrinogen-III synthase, partial [Oscillospiraceae bacterium]